MENFQNVKNGERFYFVLVLLIQTLRANFESREVNALHIDDKKITNHFYFLNWFTLTFTNTAF